MLKANETVKKETCYIAAWIGIFSLVMQAVFLAVGHWSYRVLLGNLWGGMMMILNFYFMGLSVQKAVATDEKEAKKIMQVSHTVRSFCLFVALIVGVVAPWFSVPAVLIPLIFPRIAMALRPLMKNNKEVSEKNETK